MDKWSNRTKIGYSSGGREPRGGPPNRRATVRGSSSPSPKWTAIILVFFPLLYLSPLPLLLSFFYGRKKSGGSFKPSERLNR